MPLPEPPAPLSACLFARKGEATAAMRRHAPVHGRVAMTGGDMNDRYRNQAADHAPNAARHTFTLRLGDYCHAKLRLAVAGRGRPAQQIITEALDAFFITSPEVEALAAQLPPSNKLDSSGTNS